MILLLEIQPIILFLNDFKLYIYIYIYKLYITFIILVTSHVVEFHFLSKLEKRASVLDTSVVY